MHQLLYTNTEGLQHHLALHENCAVKTNNLLMKFCLGISNEDLADRCNISNGLVSTFIASWVKAASQIVNAMVFVPEENKI